MTEQVKTKSIVAATSMATKQFTFVKLDTAGKIATPSAGGYAIGVLQDKPAAGDPGAVCFPGDITKVVCGGAINPGQDVSTDGNGAAVAATSGAYVLGQNLGGTGASGAVIAIVFQPKASKM